MNSRSKQYKRKKAAAFKAAHATQQLSSFAQVMQVMAEPPQQPGYVAATMDGVVRLDSTTPPNILGAYTEGLESCVALIFFNNKNHQCVLIHKSKAVSMRHVIDELSWVSDRFKSLKACTSHLVYRLNPSPGSSEILWGKNIADHVAFIMTDYAMCVKALPDLPKLEQHHASEGFVSINRKGKVDVNAKPSILQSSDHEKRHQMSFINNYFINNVERDTELLKLDLQYAINDWTPLAKFRLSIADMFARDEALKTGISEEIYPWLCDFSGRILLWCRQDPDISNYFNKIKLTAGKDKVNLPNVRVSELYVRLKGGGAAPAIALSFNQEWLRINPQRQVEILDYFTKGDLLISFSEVMTSRNKLSLNYLRALSTTADPEPKLADSVESLLLKEESSQQEHKSSPVAGLSAHLEDVKSKNTSQSGSAAALFADKKGGPSAVSQAAIDDRSAASSNKGLNMTPSVAPQGTN